MALLTAHDLALAYDRWLTAMSRDDDEATTRFIAWLEGFRLPTLPPEPDGPPDACSFPLPNGVGLRWYEREGAIFGYDDRAACCYRIPVDAEPPPPLPYPPYRREPDRTVTDTARAQP